MPCYYRVTERDKEKNLLHSIAYSYFSEAVADVLSKIRCPLSGHKNFTNRQSEVYVKFQSIPCRFNFDGIVNMIFYVFNKSNDEVLFSVKIQSSLSRTPITFPEEGSLTDFHNLEWQVLLRRYLNKNVKEYCDNRIGVMGVLLSAAGVDPDHNFWGEEDYDSLSLNK